MRQNAICLSACLCVLLCHPLAAQDCDPDKALGASFEAATKRAFAHLNQEFVDLGDLSDIMKKATRKDEPLSKQLSATDLARFNQLSQRAQLSQEKSDIENMRTKQLAFLKSLYKITQVMADARLSYLASGGKLDDFDWEKALISGEDKAGIKIMLKLQPLWNDSEQAVAPARK